MRTRRRRVGRLRVGALAVAIVGLSVATFAYGPSTATTRGIDPIEYWTPAFHYRLWTVVATVVISAALLIVDALLRAGDDSDKG